MSTLSLCRILALLCFSVFLICEALTEYRPTSTEFISSLVRAVNDSSFPSNPVYISTLNGIEITHGNYPSGVVLPGIPSMFSDLCGILLNISGRVTCNNNYRERKMYICFQETNPDGDIKKDDCFRITGLPACTAGIDVLMEMSVAIPANINIGKSKSGFSKYCSFVINGRIDGEFHAFLKPIEGDGSRCAKFGLFESRALPLATGPSFFLDPINGRFSAGTVYEALYNNEEAFRKFDQPCESGRYPVTVGGSSIPDCAVFLGYPYGQVADVKENATGYAALVSPDSEMDFTFGRYGRRSFARGPMGFIAIHEVPSFESSVISLIHFSEDLDEYHVYELEGASHADAIFSEFPSTGNPRSFSEDIGFSVNYPHDGSYVCVLADFGANIISQQYVQENCMKVFVSPFGSAVFKTLEQITLRDSRTMYASWGGSFSRAILLRDLSGYYSDEPEYASNFVLPSSNGRKAFIQGVHGFSTRLDTSITGLGNGSYEHSIHAYATERIVRTPEEIQNGQKEKVYLYHFNNDADKLFAEDEAYPRETIPNPFIRNYVYGAELNVLPVTVALLKAIFQKKDHTFSLYSSDVVDSLCGLDLWKTRDIAAIQSALNGLPDSRVLGSLVAQSDSNSVEMIWVPLKYHGGTHSGKSADILPIVSIVPFPNFQTSTEEEQKKVLLTLAKFIHFDRKQRVYDDIMEVSPFMMGFSASFEILGDEHEVHTVDFPLFELLPHFVEIAHRALVSDISSDDISSIETTMEPIFSDPLHNAFLDLQYYKEYCFAHHLLPIMMSVIPVEKVGLYVSGKKPPFILDPVVDRNTTSPFIYDFKGYAIFGYELIGTVPDQALHGHFSIRDVLYPSSDSFMPFIGVHSRSPVIRNEVLTVGSVACGPGHFWPSLLVTDNDPRCIPTLGSYVEEYNDDGSSNMVKCSDDQICVPGSGEVAAPRGTGRKQFVFQDEEPNLFVSLQLEEISDAEGLVTDMVGETLKSNTTAIIVAVLAIGFIALFVGPLQRFLKQFDFLSEDMKIVQNPQTGLFELSTHSSAFIGLLIITLFAVFSIVLVKMFIFIGEYDPKEAKLFDARDIKTRNTGRKCQIANTAGSDREHVHFAYQNLGVFDILFKFLNEGGCQEFFLRLNGGNSITIRDCSIGGFDCNTVFSTGALQYNQELVDPDAMDQGSHICVYDFGMVFKYGIDALGIDPTASVEFSSRSMSIEVLGEDFIPCFNAQIGFKRPGKETNYINVSNISPNYMNETTVMPQNYDVDVQLWHVIMLEAEGDKASEQILAVTDSVDTTPFPSLNLDDFSFKINIKPSENLISCYHGPIVTFGGSIITMFIALYSIYELLSVVISKADSIKELTRPIWGKRKNHQPYNNNGNPYGAIGPGGGAYVPGQQMENGQFYEPGMDDYAMGQQQPQGDYSGYNYQNEYQNQDGYDQNLSGFVDQNLYGQQNADIPMIETNFVQGEDIQNDSTQQNTEESEGENKENGDDESTEGEEDGTGQNLTTGPPPFAPSKGPSPMSVVNKVMGSGPPVQNGPPDVSGGLEFRGSTGPPGMGSSQPPFMNNEPAYSSTTGYQQNEGMNQQTGFVDQVSMDEEAALQQQMYSQQMRQYAGYGGGGFNGGDYGW